MLEIYANLLSLMTPLVICLSIGYFWSRYGHFELDFCSFLVTRISTPALIFHTLTTISLESAALMEIALLAWVALLLCAGLAGAVLYCFRLSLRMLPAVVFPNTGNFGLAISYLALGQNGFAVAVIVYTSCSVAQHSLSALTLHNSFNWTRILTLPPLVAVIMALIVRASPFDVPFPVLEAAKLIGGLTVPLMLFVLGHALANMPRSGLHIGSLLAILRLTLGILAAWLVIKVFNITDELALVLIIQMAMPVAVISYVYSQPSGSNVSDPVAGSVLVSTCLSLATIPGMLWWLGL